MIISIHTLVKRVTNQADKTSTTPLISIHTLVKRVTTLRMFNILHYIISIHTLVKRVTITIPLIIAPTNYFNSHSRKESDVYQT